MLNISQTNKFSLSQACISTAPHPHHQTISCTDLPNQHCNAEWGWFTASFFFFLGKQKILLKTFCKDMAKRHQCVSNQYCLPPIPSGTFFLMKKGRELSPSGYTQVSMLLPREPQWGCALAPLLSQPFLRHSSPAGSWQSHRRHSLRGDTTCLGPKLLWHGTVGSKSCLSSPFA